MQIIKETGDDNLAKVYIAKIGDDFIEFAESIPPPNTIEDKWVIIVSCLKGCPVKCLMCDAGQKFSGKLTKDEILDQIDYAVKKRFPGKIPLIKKFKIQFTRMGEPAFNNAVLETLDELSSKFYPNKLIPSVSTIGPKNCDEFFSKLIELKNKFYPNGRFQMQFSIHTTDTIKRDQLIPIEKMTFEEIAQFGEKFYKDGDRKITLNFIVMENYPIDPEIVKKYFNPDRYIIKMTPLNPTNNAKNYELSTRLDPNDENSIANLIEEFHKLGFETIVSIGDLEENNIGSNCGQFISNLNN